MPADPAGGVYDEGAVVTSWRKLSHCFFVVVLVLRLKIVEPVRTLLSRDLLDGDSLLCGVVIAKADFVVVRIADPVDGTDEDLPTPVGRLSWRAWSTARLRSRSGL